VVNVSTPLNKYAYNFVSIMNRVGCSEGDFEIAMESYNAIAIKFGAEEVEIVEGRCT
jgi:hypothetical protein